MNPKSNEIRYISLEHLLRDAKGIIHSHGNKFTMMKVTGKRKDSKVQHIQITMKNKDNEHINCMLMNYRDKKVIFSVKDKGKKLSPETIKVDFYAYVTHYGNSNNQTQSFSQWSEVERNLVFLNEMPKKLKKGKFHNPTIRVSGGRNITIEVVLNFPFLQAKRKKNRNLYLLIMKLSNSETFEEIVVSGGIVKKLSGGGILETEIQATTEFNFGEEFVPKWRTYKKAFPYLFQRPIIPLTIRNTTDMAKVRKECGKYNFLNNNDPSLIGKMNYQPRNANKNDISVHPILPNFEISISEQKTELFQNEEMMSNIGFFEKMGEEEILDDLDLDDLLPIDDFDHYGQNEIDFDEEEYCWTDLINVD